MSARDLLAIIARRCRAWGRRRPASHPHDYCEHCYECYLDWKN